MSDDIRQEVDKVESARIIVIGVAALVIFALGIVWAISIQRESAGTIRSYTPEQVPVGRKDEIGIVYQPTFEIGDFAAKAKARELERLSSVGWVNQAAKKTHIPIDRAIDDYLAVAAQNGGKL